MKLSIIIPAFNERKTITKVLKSVESVVIPSAQKQIIVVDDGSVDGTGNEIKKYIGKRKDILFLSQEKNQGKGAAIRLGIDAAKGEYTLIQDADLEYNPKDIVLLVDALRVKRAQVVYGTRLKRMPNFSRDERTPQFLLHYVGNKLLSLLTSLLYGQWITDMETGYKLFPTQAVRNLELKARSFEFEPEITAKLLKCGYKITEVPISTNPRGYEEGKKLNTVKDGFIALYTLLKFRFRQ